jgi:signal peptidase I
MPGWQNDDVLVGRAVVAVAGVSSLAFLLWARSRFVYVAITGTSMSPTYQPGERVLVRRRSADRMRVHDVVVVEQPDDSSGWRHLSPFDGQLVGRRWQIKRVAALPGDLVPDVVRDSVVDMPECVPYGSLVVLGDNRVSVDSRYWGLYPADRLLGVVVGAGRHRNR